MGSIKNITNLENLRFGNVSPAAFGNLKLWVAADRITGKSDGNTITQWDDLSDNANHLTEATNPPIYKTNQMNGLPVVRFDGMATILTKTFSAIITDFTVFVVARINTGAANPTGGGAFSSSSSNVAKNLVIDTNVTPGWRILMRNDADTANSVITLSDVVNDQATILRVVTNGSGATGAANNVVATPVSDPTQTHTNRFRLGSNRAATLFFAGDIAEVIVYHNDLSDSDIDQVERYLATKYAITLA